jgi:hypothetical protein
MKKQEQLEIINYLDTLVSEGNKISIGWTGGGDSGWCWFAINDTQVSESSENNYIKTLLDYMYSELDYGSWAGDYSADGAVYYNKDEGSFIGEGKDTTSDGGCLEGISIEIRVPKYLNFDSIDMETEGTFCFDELVCSFRFGINNGPVFEEHSDIEKSMESYLLESVTHILQTDEACKDEEIGWVSNTWSIPREEFKEEEDSLVFIIDSIDYNFNNTIFQSYHITINEEQ